ncbi:binary toxin-like calcium binding domain-containing protein [Bacillus cereus]|uniref:Iota toxin protein Ib n=1 Tax=Bacillus cereus TaxID=1396 RepID=A0A9X6X5J3_BACCE|nr:binary toxin-like calcium binding domain-containing protein [Bacillus cereus]PFK27805.1 Iota toxin protein Ib [Bacillus cereus]
MKLKNFYKCLAITTLLSQFAVLPDTSHAATEKEEKNKPGPSLISVENPGKGLLGYYFKDSQFSDLVVIQPNTSGELHFNNKTQKALSSGGEQNIQSARWIGYIKPSKTDEYQLSTSSDTNVVIQLDGNLILDRSTMDQYIKLEKDKIYEIKIEYRGESNPLVDLELFWSTSDMKKDRIPDKNLLAPNFSEKVELPLEKSEKFLIPNVNLFDGQRQSTRSKRSLEPMLQDTDKDGIPDEWELNGYTIKNGALTPWDDSYSSQGYTKYISHPYNARTASDPYTDFQKVTGYMPAATKAEARDPLVAAYPAVGVGMEKLIFSKNENVTEGSTNTKSTSTTKTKSNTNTVDIGAKIGFSDKGLSFEFSPRYVHSWTSSTAVQDTKGETWSKQIGINTDQAAFLNANVRYYNAGTAPIYEVRPTTNFMLRNANQSLTTIKAGPNQIGNSLAPGDSYPKKGQGPISLDKANEAGTMKISLNAAQLDSIQSQGEIIDLETTQSSGQYGILDPLNGNLVTDAGKQWDHIRSNIDATSGSLILETGNETLERRVAARDINNPEDRTPEITIKEAIKKAFGAIEKNGLLYYKEQDTGKEIPIHESAVNIVVDEKTQTEWNKQLEQMPGKSVYDLTFKRGMNITLLKPIVYDDFESSNGWNYTSYVNGGHTGKKNGIVSPGATAYRQEKLNLKPYTSYTVRAWIKSESTSKQTLSVHVDNQAGKGRGLNQELQLEGSDWKLLEIAFNTGNHPEYFSEIAIGNKGNKNLHFDDVSITQWYPTEDLIRNHVVSQWNASKMGYVDGVTLSKVPNTKVRYQLEIDGKLTDIKQASSIDSQGKRFINFKDFNNGNSIYAGSHISVYAVDEKNDNLKVKITENGDQKLRDQLRPSNISYFYKQIHNAYTFEIRTGANAPNASYKVVNLTNNTTHNMWSGGPNTSIWADWLAYNPNDEYAVVAVVDGKEYFVYKDKAKNLMPQTIHSGTYQMVSALNNSSVIDLNQSNNNIILHQNKNGNNQKWKLVYDSNKSAYQIKNIANENLVLAWNDYQGSNNVFATPNRQYEEHYWIVEDAGYGYFYLKNKKNSKYLDVTGSGSANGTNIIVYNFTGNSNQKFKLQKLN